MKKLVIAVVGLLCFAPAVFADNWGFGLRLGAGENDPKGMEEVYDQIVANKELDKNGGVFGMELMYEWNLNDEANKIGAKIGWDVYGENELKYTTIVGTEKFEETTYAFPLTVYYKRDNGVQNLSWFAGAGISFLRTELEASGLVNDKTHKSKVFPHITVGGEYRFTEVFALGLDAKYNIGAKAKKDGAVYSDRSGFSAALTGRFYF
jgi:hypothetical protein